MDLGRIASLEKDHKPVEVARKGDAVAMKIEVGARRLGRAVLVRGRSRRAARQVGPFEWRMGLPGLLCCCWPPLLCSVARSLRPAKPMAAILIYICAGHQAGGGEPLVRAPL